MRTVERDLRLELEATPQTAPPLLCALNYLFRAADQVRPDFLEPLRVDRTGLVAERIHIALRELDPFHSVDLLQDVEDAGCALESLSGFPFLQGHDLFPDLLHKGPILGTKTQPGLGTDGQDHRVDGVVPYGDVLVR